MADRLTYTGAPMRLIEIVKAPDEVLRTPCQAVGEVTDEVRELTLAMLDTMYAAGGIGLAAPQVGHALRLFVMCVTGRKEDELVLIDPVVEPVDTLHTWKMVEGCLSLPGVRVEVERPIEV